MRKVRNGFRRAGIQRLSTGQSHLIVRVSLHTNKKVQTPHKRILDFWSEWRDSNSRHPGPKPGALPTGPHPGTMGHYTSPWRKNQSNFAFHSKNKTGGLTAPTHSLYHTPSRAVNHFLSESLLFYHLHDSNPTFLSDFPS